MVQMLALWGLGCGTIITAKSHFLSLSAQLQAFSADLRRALIRRLQDRSL